VIRAFAEAGDRGRIERFEARGYSTVRYFVDMVRDLADPLPAVEWPDGVEMVPWSSRWVDPAWEAHCEAFADHWGSLPPTLDEWRHSCERPGFRPDLTVLAVVGDQVVAYTRNGVYPHDWEVRGRRDGWIDTLGTRPAWRRRGLASGLIAESMHRIRGAGLSHAALGVDAENPTGALGLYTRLGFVETNRAVALTKRVPNPGLGAR
jgi:ribosomal protein S18 acetylase RimI-like enzyme